MVVIRVKDKEWQLHKFIMSGLGPCAMDLVCHWRWSSLRYRQAMYTYWCLMESILYRLADCISWMKVLERLKESKHLRNTVDSIMEQW